MRDLGPKMLRLTVVAVFGLAVAASTASAAPAVTGVFETGNEFGFKNKIVAGPDGNMWFTLASGKDVGKITPSGKVTEYDLEEVEGATGIAPGPEGKLWVPTTNKVTSFSPGDPEGTDETFASTLINTDGQIVAGPEGLMWVGSAGALMHFSPSDPEGTDTEVPTKEPTQAADIDVAGSLIVVADNGGGNARIDTFTKTGVEQDYPLPSIMMTQGVAGAPNGQIAFTGPVATPEQAGLISPPAAASPFELVGDPVGVAYASDDAFWIAQREATVTRLTASGVRTTVGGLPSESPRQIAAGPNNTLWVTLEKSEKGKIETSAVARISGLEPPTPPMPPGTPGPIPVGPIGVPISVKPETVIGKGPKGRVPLGNGDKLKVKFTFSSSLPGSTFQCALSRGLRTKKGRISYGAPKFVGCGSPRKYKLGLGRYRFEVRASATSGVDPSPAKRTFRVVAPSR